MSLKDLTKEQKQYVFLGVLAAAILIVLIGLGVRVSLSSISEAKADLEGLSGDIESAERVLSRRGKNSEEFRSTVKLLRSHLENVPPERNYYSWATEVVYSHAHQVGLEIDTINEITQNQGGGKEEPGIRIESYALRISAHGGYQSVKEFIGSLQQDFPLIRFTGLDISAGQNPERHNVQLWVQWPINLGSFAESWASVESRQRELGEREDRVSVESVSETKIPDEAVSEPASRLEPTPPPPRIKPVSDLAQSAESVSEPEPRKAPTPPEPRVVPAEPEEKVVVEAAAEIQPEDESSAIPEPEPAVPVVEEPARDGAAIMNSESAVPVVEEQPEPEAPVEIPVSDPSLPVSEPVETAVPADNVSAAGEVEAEEQVSEAAETLPEDPEEASDPADSTYITTEKSARKLEALLGNQDVAPTNDSLNSLINSLMEGSK